jgi:nucleoside-diphosphate-sugar epimerase
MLQEENIDALEIAHNLHTHNHWFGGKTVLIVGAAGFLGSVLRNYFNVLNETYLEKNPVKIIASDCYAIGNTPKIKENENLKVINHDICYPFNLKISPNEKIDFILNMASIASPVFYKKNPLLTFNVGAIGTQNILDLAYQKQVKSIVCMSSSEVYGNPDDSNIPTKESYNGNLSTTGERACYDESKRCLETLCDIYYRLYSVPIKVIRPFNCYGPPMSLNDGRVLPSFIKKAMLGETISVYGEGSETRTFSYCSDFVTGLIKILLSPFDGETFNLGSDNTGEISMFNLAQLVTKIIDTGSYVEKVPYPDVYKVQPKRRCPNLLKVKERFGYLPKVSLEEGIKRYYNWAIKQNDL